LEFGFIVADCNQTIEMERIPDQMGYLIMTMDGAVISVSKNTRNMFRKLITIYP